MIRIHKLLTSVIFLIFTACGLVKPGKLYSQVTGCNDPNASNYNLSATVNDGSCLYDTIFYTPPVKLGQISDTLIETSGLQMADNFLWSFNDGGGAAAIYRIDTSTGYILQTVTLQGAANVDWEDIAFDGTHFYIGDFGNNANGGRTDLTIYKLALGNIPAYESNPVVTIPASQIGTIYFTYSTQPQPPVATDPNKTKFDCEAMVIDSGKIHLFTKNWVDTNTVHYVINATAPGLYQALPVDTLNTHYLVTAADKAPGQKVIALLGYSTTGFANHFIHLLSDYKDGKYFNGNKRRLDLSNAFTMGQAEGIAFRNGSYGYISNEKFIRYIGNVPVVTVFQKLRSFSISNFVYNLAATYKFTGNGNWHIAANWLNSSMPPANLTTGSEILIDPLLGGKCILMQPYTLPTGCKLSVSAGKIFEVMGNLIIQ